MILSPSSLSRHYLTNNSLGYLSARLNPALQINLHCDFHNETPQFVCLHDPCTKHVLCHECVPMHSESHKTFLLPYKEVMGNDLIKKIDQELVFNLTLEQKNEVYYKHLQQVELTFEDIRKRIDKTLTSIFKSIREQTLSYCIDPIYPTIELDKLKKLLVDRKNALSKATPDHQAKCLHEYVKAYSLASSTFIDVGTTKDLRGPADLDAAMVPELEQEDIDDTIKALRKVIYDFSSRIMVQVMALNSPEENMRRTQHIIPEGNNPNLTSTPEQTHRRAPKTNSLDPASHASIAPTRDRLQDNSMSSARNTFLGKFKSFNPEEIGLLRVSPFIYDEYLETEVIDIAYTGPIKMRDGTTYKGQMLDGKRVGKGKQTWEDGRIYEGYFKNDTMNGKGRMTHPDQEVYEGLWLNGKAHGKGKYSKPDGWIYEGDWFEDEIHGKGTEIWPDGSIYEGDFEKGVKSGYGTLIGPDGSCYNGGFRNNVFAGEGKYIWIDGRKYEGTWANNLMEGKGVMTWPDGRKYDGDFVKDKREGFGKYSWGDGRRYNGYWKDGKQHGKGKLQNKAGKVVEGEWREGKMLTDIASAFQQGKSTISVDSKEKAELKVKVGEGRKSQFSESNDQSKENVSRSVHESKEGLGDGLKDEKRRSQEDRGDIGLKATSEKSDETRKEELCINS